jgi:hypothetical protein
MCAPCKVLCVFPCIHACFEVLPFHSHCACRVCVLHCMCGRPCNTSPPPCVRRGDSAPGRRHTRSPSSLSSSTALSPVPLRPHRHRPTAPAALGVGPSDVDSLAPLASPPARRVPVPRRRRSRQLVSARRRARGRGSVIVSSAGGVCVQHRKSSAHLVTRAICRRRRRCCRHYRFHRRHRLLSVLMAIRPLTAASTVAVCQAQISRPTVAPHRHRCRPRPRQHSAAAGPAVHCSSTPRALAESVRITARTPVVALAPTTPPSRWRWRRSRRRAAATTIRGQKAARHWDKSVESR